MGTTKYLALLRGINVGGNNIIKMTELKNLFENMGFTEVSTYIQSGNVIFAAPEKNKTAITEKIEKTLSEKLGNPVSLALLTRADMGEIISRKPEGFGEHKDSYKYDVIFLIGSLTPKKAAGEISVREGVDVLHEGKKVVYISRLIRELTKSYLSKIVGTPVYRNITIRNWNTTEKLYLLLSNGR
jgi:uncharacterized protein (DUF1697 family)